MRPTTRSTTTTSNRSGSLLKKIWDKDLIYQGYKVVPYDPRIGATLSSHEVAQGYKEVEDPSITVRFRIEGEDEHLLPGLDHDAVDAAVQPRAGRRRRRRLRYCTGRRRDADPGRGAARVGAAATSSTSVTKTVKGSELVGTALRAPVRLPRRWTRDAALQVYAADFVSTEDGTGIVHIAPAYGVDDLALGQAHGLPVVHGVGLDGHFIAEVEPVAGMFFKDADKPLIRTSRSAA